MLLCTRSSHLTIDSWSMIYVNQVWCVWASSGVQQLAFSFSNSFITGTCPVVAAQCKGLAPRSGRQVSQHVETLYKQFPVRTGAPCSSLTSGPISLAKKAVAELWPRAAAHRKAEAREGTGTGTACSCSHSINLRMTSTWPFQAAQCKGGKPSSFNIPAPAGFRTEIPSTSSLLETVGRSPTTAARWSGGRKPTDPM